MNKTRDILNKYAAGISGCEAGLFSKPTKTPIVFERRDVLKCPDGRPMPFIGFDNGIAQVFCVHPALAKPLKKVIFLSTNWSKYRLDLHDVAFFEDEYLPLVQKIAPHNWSKILHMYSTGKAFRPAKQRHKVERNIIETSCSNDALWVKEAEFYITSEIKSTDSRGKKRTINEEVSIAEVMRMSGVDAAQISVGTHYQFRGQGMARSVVSAAVQYIIDTGRIPIYGVASENFGSIKLAESLGFQRYGKTLVYLGKLISK